MDENKAKQAKDMIEKDEMGNLEIKDKLKGLQEIERRMSEIPELVLGVGKRKAKRMSLLAVKLIKQ